MNCVGAVILLCVSVSLAMRSSGMLLKLRARGADELDDHRELLLVIERARVRHHGTRTWSWSPSTFEKASGDSSWTRSIIGIGHRLRQPVGQALSLLTAARSIGKALPNFQKLPSLRRIVLE